MKYAILAVAAISMVLVMSVSNAEAQLAGNKAFLLSGTGFAVSKESISDSSAELVFSTTQSKTKTDFVLQSGVLIVDDKDIAFSDFSANIFNNGNIFKFVSKATDTEGKKFTVKGLGKLIDKTSNESIYALSGTLTDSSNKVTKLIYTGKVSEFVVKPIDTTPKPDVTIKILKGAATPELATYETQTGGFKFNFVSEDRISISPGGTITFLNEDNTSHSLKSGNANYRSHKKAFTEDGKISSGEIAPGKSWSVTFDKRGFFRLFDEKYQWIDITIFVSDVKVSTTKTPLN